MIKKKDLDQGNIQAWEEYIKNPSDIYDKDKNYSKDNDRNGRFKYDLHGYTLDDANRKVREIILSCKEKNYKEKKIIYTSTMGLMDLCLMLEFLILFYLQK